MVRSALYAKALDLSCLIAHPDPVDTSVPMEIVAESGHISDDVADFNPDLDPFDDPGAMDNPPPAAAAPSVLESMVIHSGLAPMRPAGASTPLASLPVAIPAPPGPIITSPVTLPTFLVAMPKPRVTMQNLKPTWSTDVGMHDSAVLAKLQREHIRAWRDGGAVTIAHNAVVAEKVLHSLDANAYMVVSMDVYEECMALGDDLNSDASEMTI